MAKRIAKRIEETDEAKAIIKAYLDGKPYNEILEMSEYTWVEFWLGELNALAWLEMTLECTDPLELERLLRNEKI